MSNLIEYVITSDSSGQLWNSCIWDPHAGTSLMVYKGGGTSAPHTLCFLGNDYLISADSVKPLLHIWPLNSQELVQKGLRTVCPGRVSALTVSPDACYCIAGIEEKLHIWQISSGRLLAVTTRHFQKITCVRFTDDSSHFVSGAEDGMVMVWSLANLLCSSTGDSGDPRHVFSAHSLPVQDLVVGHGGIRARLVSVSIDRACKVYDLASGVLLLSVIFSSPLTTVTMDLTELNMFVGAADGNIHQFIMQEPPRMQEYHVGSTDDKSITFVGHTKAVTCLSASQDGVTLLSGSNDERVFVWHIPSRQCIRILPHKGPITNAFFFIAPKQVFTNEFKPTVLLHSFQRGMSHDVENIVSVMTTENLYENEHDVQVNGNQVLGGNSQDTKLKEERDLYKHVNHELYKFAIDNILKQLHSNSDTHGKEVESLPRVIGTKSQTQQMTGLPSSKKLKKKKKVKKLLSSLTSVKSPPSNNGIKKKKKKKNKKKQ